VPNLMGIALAVALALPAQTSTSKVADEAVPSPLAAPASEVAPVDEGKLRVLVLEPKVTGDQKAARIVGSLIAVDLGAIESIEVTTTEDLQRMLEVEAERQALGCSDTSVMVMVRSSAASSSPSSRVQAGWTPSASSGSR
jgi:hypothetical protein